MKIIGVSGLPGSGKSLVSEFAKTKGISVVSMGDIVREEAEKRNEAPGITAVNLRKEQGEYVLAKLTIEKIKKFLNDNLNEDDFNSDSDDEPEKSDLLLVEGIRSPYEVNMFKENFNDFIIVSVFSSPETRFRRLKKRNREDDSFNLKDFQKRDQRELKFGIGTVIACSEFIIINESDIFYYKKQFSAFFQKYID
ncbi:MAG: AAA family ATPase [Methanobrevibacter sp.]|nr:AAA family ATPase [Methanobrevibacter sp.]